MHEIEVVVPRSRDGHQFLLFADGTVVDGGNCRVAAILIRVGNQIEVRIAVVGGDRGGQGIEIRKIFR